MLILLHQVRLILVVLDDLTRVAMNRLPYVRHRSPRVGHVSLREGSLGIAHPALNDCVDEFIDRDVQRLDVLSSSSRVGQADLRLGHDLPPRLEVLHIFRFCYEELAQEPSTLELLYVHVPIDVERYFLLVRRQN